MIFQAKCRRFYNLPRFKFTTSGSKVTRRRHCIYFDFHATVLLLDNSSVRDRVKVSRCSQIEVYNRQDPSVVRDFTSYPQVSPYTNPHDVYSRAIPSSILPSSWWHKRGILVRRVFIKSLPTRSFPSRKLPTSRPWTDQCKSPAWVSLDFYNIL